MSYGFGAQLRPSHVPDPHDGAVGVDADGDGGELLGVFKQVLDDDGGVQPLPFYRGPAAELAGGDLDVIDLSAVNDVLDGQPVVVQLVRVEPDAHGILGAEDVHLAHAGYPREHLLQVRLGIIPEVVAVHAAVFGDRPTIDQVVPRGLATVMPPRCTTSGRLVMASCSLFCTFAQARSGSVPGAKVSSMRDDPDESLVAER